MTPNEAIDLEEPVGGKNPAGSQSPESVLIMHFNGCQIDLPYKSQENKNLRDALVHVRRIMNVPSWMILSARDPENTGFLNEEIQLSEVAQKLEGDKYLEISIEFSASSEPFSKDIRTAVGASFTRQFEDRTDPDETRPTISLEEKIYPFGPDGVVVIRRNMLPILRDHLRYDHASVWINRICGALLGASITIGLTLFNDSLSEMFRSNLKLALLFCAAFLLALAGIEKYGRSGRSDSLETLIDNSVKGEHSE